MFDFDGFEIIVCFWEIEGVGLYCIFIVVMIVYVMKGDCECCFEVGMDDYFVKLLCIEWFYVVFDCWML